MAFTYPASVYDQPQAVKAQLGSFWATFYGGRDTVDAFCLARGQVEQQTLSDINELVDCTGRRTIPTYHRIRWLPLVFRHSDQQPGRMLAYGDGAYFGNQPGTNAVYTYGGHRDTTVAYPVSSGIKQIPLIMERVLDASMVLTTQVDFMLDVVNSRVIFRNDPFADPSVELVPIYNSVGEIADWQITLWAFQVDIDKKFIWTQFGHVVGLQLDSSDGYKDIVNQGWDALLGGTAAQQVENVLATCVGAPLAVAGETVLFITTDNFGPMILTDQHVYRYGAGATALVAVGDVTYAGQSLCDTLRMYDLNTGVIPPVSSIALGKGFLHPSISGPLTFENTELALTATVAGDGHTVATFPITGDAADVARFFELLDARGVANGNTLAHVLDVRTNPVGEPAPFNLPATLNPMVFLIQNVLRFNTFLAILDSTTMGPDAVGTDQLSFLRKLVPPTAALLLVIE